MCVHVCVCVGGGGLLMTVFGKALFRSISATTLSTGYTAVSTRDSVWILVLSGSLGDLKEVGHTAGEIVGRIGRLDC